MDWFNSAPWWGKFIYVIGSFGLMAMAVMLVMLVIRVVELSWEGAWLVPHLKKELVEIQSHNQKLRMECTLLREKLTLIEGGSYRGEEP